MNDSKIVKTKEMTTKPNEVKETMTNGEGAVPILAIIVSRIDNSFISATQEKAVLSSNHKIYVSSNK